jgi:alkylation response protein AidB-like acyl-CoA dehydrogenase
LAAQGLHGLQAPHAAAQGLHGLQAPQEARTMGFSPAETAVGSKEAPAVMVTTVTATMVSFNIASLSPMILRLLRPESSNPQLRLFETWTVIDNGGNNLREKGSRSGIAIS